MDNTENHEEEITHQQSLVQDSFSSIERLENEMAVITKEFESLDSGVETSDAEPEPEQSE